MIQAKCIQKFRDKTGKIYGYRLIDLNQQTQDVTPENLKKAIIDRQINVINLTLTSDNRLVDSSEKQLQSKKLGPTPNNTTKSNNILKEVAKAFVELDLQLLDMGDSREELIENLCYTANINVDFDSDEYYEDEEKYMHKIHTKAYEVLLKEESSLITDNIDYYSDNADTIIHCITCSKTDNINDNNIIKSVIILAKYIEHLFKNGKCTKETYYKINEIKNDLLSIDLHTCIFGKNVGYTFFKYLDGNYFLKSNTSFVVGSIKLKSEKESKLGSYVINAMINNTELPSDQGFTVGFIKTDQGIKAMFYYYYYVNKQNNREITYNPIKLTLDIKDTSLEQENIDKVSKQIANKINELAVKKYGKL